MTWIDEFRNGWRGLSEPPWALTLGFAAACLALGTALRFGLSLLRPDLPFTPYIPAVVVATVFGGARIGSATALAGVALGYALQFGPGPAGGAKLALAAVYLATCGVFVWGVAHYRGIVARHRATTDRLVAEERYRKLIVEELQHRLRNKASTIHAVARQVLRDHPDAWARIDGRIRALSAADNLIVRADGGGCTLRDLLVSELEPYGHVRYTLTGDVTVLPAKLAVSLALIFHELATNAAKYGSFASTSGLLNVTWRQDADRLHITWDETEGPPVQPPTTTGFGTQLLASALRAFDGDAELQFLPTGLRCTITCRVPSDTA
ncbi:MAG: sensor histidine kinase [Pseudomonadota bacterium]